MASCTRMDLLSTCMAVPVYVAEEIAVGRCLLQNFIHETFEEEGVPDEILEEMPEEILEEIVPDQSASSAQYTDADFASVVNHIGIDPHTIAMQVGANIRELANEFAKSRERKHLKKEAEKIDAATINKEQFFALCEQVFLDGITKERIVLLFFFFADVLINCVRSEMKQFGLRLFKWALQYLVDRVISWVARHGGWENAIKNTFTVAQIAAMGAGAVLVVAVGGFFFYKWQS